MKQLNKKKTVKGMTLVEIIIAFFVFGVTALIMVQVAIVANNLTRQSIHVNRKVSIQNPYSESRSKTTDDTIVDQGTVGVTVNNSTFTSGTLTSGTVRIRGEKYSTSGTVDPDDTFTNRFDANLGYVDIDISSTAAGGHNIYVEPTTEAPT